MPTTRPISCDKRTKRDLSVGKALDTTAVLRREKNENLHLNFEKNVPNEGRIFLMSSSDMRFNSFEVIERVCDAFFKLMSRATASAVFVVRKKF